MDLKGKALTVLGPVSPGDLGHTLPHEHLLVNGSPFATEPQSTKLRDLPITMETLGQIRYYPYSVMANLKLDIPEELTSELRLFKSAGGGCVCDVTVTGLRCQPGPELLPQISRESGVHIITGTGFYVNSFLPDYAKSLSSNQMAEQMYSEIVGGCEGGVRCGVIGEIGCSYPLLDSEKRALQAAAMVQTRTGAPLIVHPGRHGDAPAEIASILETHGADLSRTVMSHLDRTFSDDQTLLKFARLGCLLEYDLFGMECSHYQMNSAVDMPSDAQRIQRIQFLIENGFADKILISHDLHTKVRLARYGGHGYSHIVEHIVPKMVSRGIPHEVVTAMTRDTPQKWLTFV